MRRSARPKIPSSEKFTTLKTVQFLNVENLMRFKDSGPPEVIEGEDVSWKHQFRRNDRGKYSLNNWDRVAILSNEGETWYGVITDIRVEVITDTTANPWVEVQWFFRKKDFGSAKANFRKWIGDNELVLCLDKNIVDPECIQSPQDIIQYDDAAPYSPRIMPGDIYFRWEMVCVPGKKVAMYQLKTWHHIACLEPLGNASDDVPEIVLRNTTIPGVELDGTFEKLLRTPIERGEEQGLVGNGGIIMPLWKLFRDLKQKRIKSLPDRWLDNNDVDLIKWQLSMDYNYFHCPTCRLNGRECYM
ncbi:hypothetical protein HYDPIDRAFT_170988 [Hydnomerulius pinastri MD-312]|uniref:BAH domain-containing protein n=1 Tax=Hydnomerulius pinastri MD-312 TaxID=994086 RepID=A0A0C9VN52_9AGAM|nr:hypothetical protein HYDPIDRAFT_170988 [Hydnomerulius pinastri MD-312]